MIYIISLGWIFPSPSLSETVAEDIRRFTVNIAGRFGLTNTVIVIDIWRDCADQLSLIEVNARASQVLTAGYTKMYGASGFDAAVRLACGQTTEMGRFRDWPLLHRRGQPITGYFSLVTSSAGTARDLINFDAVTDEAYSSAGPGVAMSVNTDTVLHQGLSTGTVVCVFMLTDVSVDELLRRRLKIMRKVMKKEEHLDLVKNVLRTFNNNLIKT